MCKFRNLYKYDNILHALKVLMSCNENVHRYKTCNKKLPKISKHTTAQNSFLVKSTMSYIEIKNTIKRKKNVYKFIKALKNDLLSRY